MADAAYFALVYQEAVEVGAFLCDMFDYDPMADGVIIDHADGHRRGMASNHADVEHWFRRHGKSMATLRQDIADLLANSEVLEPPSATPDEEITDALDNRPFRVRRSWADATSQIGAFNVVGHSVDAARSNPGFRVFDDNGHLVYEPQVPPEPFRVRVTANSLPVHHQPNAQSPIDARITDRGVYTIVEGTNGWGRLLSGAGWIMLNGTIRL